MNTDNSLTIRDTSAERDNRWFSRTSGQQIQYHSDSLSRNPNVIRFPVTSTIVKQSSAYIPLPQTQTTVTTHTIPVATTISTNGVQLGIGQSFNITSSKNNIPASYVVGPPTIISNAPKQLHGSFGTLPFPPASPSLQMSSVKHQQAPVSSVYRPGSSTLHINTNPNLNIHSDSVNVNHQRCIVESKNWELKYNELYSIYLGLSNQRSKSPNESLQIQRLRQENRRLEQRVLTLEQNERRINQTVEVYIGDIINKFRESTTRETGLLFDRFRLQCRAMDKP